MILRPIRTLYRRQLLRRSLHEVFEFFECPGNLPRITPPWLGFRIVTPEPLTMKRGLTIDYSVRVFGFRTHWRSAIVAFDPPHGFRDTQVIGPYRLWDHQHRFRHENGGTLIEDFVVYEPPLGPLGAVLDALTIRRQLAAIFDYRARRVDELLGGDL